MLDKTSKKIRSTADIQGDANQQLYDLFMQSPAIIAVLKEPNHIFELANARYMQLIGEDRNIIGKPIKEALPELKDQGFYELLDKVYQTGKSLTGNETLVKLDRTGNGKTENSYLNFVYQPSRDLKGKINGVLVHAVDVTEQVKARQLVEENEARYRSLFNSIDEGFCIVDVIVDKRDKPIDYRIVEVNPIFEKQTGLVDSVGKTARDLGLEQEWIDLYGKVAVTGKSNRITQGSETLGKWFDVYASRVGGNESKRVAIVFNDISDRKQAEIALRKSESYYREMTDNTPVITWITDAEGKCTYLNKQWYDYTGQTEAEALGFGWLEATHPDDKKRAGEIFVNSNKKQEPFTAEYRLRTINGGYRWAIDHGKPKFDANGNYEGYIGTVIDINERKLAEEELKNSIERQNIMLKASSLGLWYCDLPFDELIWDDKVKEHFWLPKNARVTIDMFYDIIHIEDRKATREAIEYSNKNHTPYDIVYRTVNPNNGKIKWIRAFGRTFYDEKGKPVRFDGMTLDITEQKNLEKQKDEFLGIASHELKTPVTSIKAYGQVLQTIFSRKGDTKAVEQLMKMDVQIDKLTNLIGDLLDVTKIQSGRLEFHQEYFDFNKLAKGIVDELQLTTERHVLVKKFTESKKVYGDKERIGQVIINLITNAIKYSPHTEKIIIKSIYEKDAVTLSVEDFGVGIPKEKKEKVFEQFFRVSGPQYNTVPGLGLGLYISSEIIKRQGGKIWVESTVGKGSTFCFTIPINKRNIKQQTNTNAVEEMKHD